MYGQSQSSGRPEGREDSFIFKGGFELLKMLAKEYLKKIAKETDNFKKIILCQELATKFVEIHPLKEHPAIKLAYEFCMSPGYRTLYLNDENKFSDARMFNFYQDIISFPEIAKSIKLYSSGDAHPGTKIPLKRNLQNEGESSYVEGFFKDLIYNPTRALLGSFNGSINLSIRNSKRVYIIEIENNLNWVSATRFPPSLGGYENDPNRQRSLVSDIPGWETEMIFKFSYVI
jgi:hypothetical protein